ncbi:hypothetical protein LRS10_17785 [Phenylobacterium sp. J426]|uniref:hypothetical protein n=1 Tax=Phenylobacterium sp. J426 TaxID=2898439 RepID=UPI0021510446|nr:hypothetical protein [Phenylobacterium sp. J426]MCR5875850.1 hypothetical protein [Phenylobacterium sp. J426]
MEDLFRSYWWLLFPLGFFVFGAWDRWLAYKRSQARLDLLRAYTSQGKDPPAELLKVIRDTELDDVDDDEYAWGERRRHMRRRYRSPYWALRTALVTGAVAAGFWLAAEYAGPASDYWPFRLVAIILTCVAVGHGIVAVLSYTLRGR